MRLDQEDTKAFNTYLKSARFSNSTKILTGPVTITHNGSLVNFLDANGADRIVTMPPLEAGRFYVLSNTGATGNLDVRSANDMAISTIEPSESSMMFSGEAAWTSLLAGSGTIGIFTNILDGLVPAPHSVTPGTLFLRDDGAWASTGGGPAIADTFKNVTDGTNTAVAAGADTLKFRSSTGTVSAVVTNNDVTHGDNVNLAVIAAAIDHDALLNFVANEHVDHSTVTLTAGTGLSGGGTIVASRTFDFAPSELTTATPVAADFAVYDLAAGGPRKATWTSVTSIINHNTLLNYVADQHVAHSGVSIVAGVGLSGGGDLTTSRVLALDVNELTVVAPAVGDFIPFYDISGTDSANKMTVSTLNGALDHDALINYAANEHFADAVSDSTTWARENGAWVRIPTITVGTTAPSSPAVNDVWIDTT